MTVLEGSILLLFFKKKDKEVKGKSFVSMRNVGKSMKKINKF